MALLTNVYAPEDSIVSALEPLFATGMIVRDFELEQKDNKIFKGVLKADGVACLVQYASMLVLDKLRDFQKVQFQYRIIVFAPKESYKDVAGVKFIEVIRTLKTIVIDGACDPLCLIDDNREFNTPEFLIDVVAIPCLVAFNVVL